MFFQFTLHHLRSTLLLPLLPHQIFSKIFTSLFPLLLIPLWSVIFSYSYLTYFTTPPLHSISTIIINFPDPTNTFFASPPPCPNSSYTHITSHFHHTFAILFTHLKNHIPSLFVFPNRP